MSDEKMLEPVVGSGEASMLSKSKQTESKQDGFTLNPKYKSVEEQAKAYGEAQKMITQKSQEVAELKKQLDEANLLFKGFEDKGKNINLDAHSQNVVEAQKPQNDIQNTQFEAKTSQNVGIAQQANAPYIDPAVVADSKLADLQTRHQQQLSNINQLFKSGQITLAQAIKLKETLDEKMNNSTQNVLNLANNMQSEIQELRKTKTIDGFKAQKPDFFSANERLEVLEYLKNASDDLSAQELENVSRLVEKVENGAIERFKRMQAQNDLIYQANEQAKVRLNSAVEATGSSVGGDRIFTKEEIQGMSNKEFRKNEKQIMAQMKKGQIK